MQGKGAIQFIAIALVVSCIYSLSFTFIANSVEKDAKAFGNGDPKKEQAYLDSIGTEPVFSLGFKDITYDEAKEKKLNLGLDLKGGMNVTMEVSLSDLVKSLADNTPDENFNRALRMADERKKDSQTDFITLFFEAYRELEPTKSLAATFATKENQGRISFNSTDDEILTVLQEEANSAIDRSFEILRTRIDKFGVTQPNIQLLEGSNRIVIELPGVNDKERVRKLLQGTAQLEFWETWENPEAIGYITQINEMMRLKEAPAVDSTVAATETEEDTATDGLSLLDDIASDTSDTSSDNGLAEFQKNNPLFAVMTPAVGQNDQGQEVAQEGPLVGYVQFKDTAKMNTILKMPEVKNIIPGNMKFLWTVKPIGTSNLYGLVAIKTTSRDKKPPLAGDVITNARADFNINGSPEVEMTMNTEGARIWKRITKENIGRSVAIVLDNYVYTYPTVQSEISGGVSSISGNFTINETKDLSNILKAGKLPAPTKIVEEEIVGPSLGKEAIQAGLISAISGLVLVLLFMIFYYSTAGFVANLALFANVFFIFGVLASLNAVLTLPGIAGIVLTIGMSVDANVLIYERIREELARGKGLKLAISDGYKNAYSSIVDANVTTLLTGIVLYVFGTGPILGFATTLIIGILTSLFSAIFITRLIFEWQVRKEKNVKFSIKSTENVFSNTKFDFITKRKIAYMISGTVIAIGIVSIVVRGFSLGVDFKGGRSYVVRFDETVSTTDVRASLGEAFQGSPEVKIFGSAEQLKITTTYLINENEPNTDSLVEAALDKGLVGFNTPFEIMSSQKVGPTIANDIKVGAFWAVLMSMIIVFIYLLIRFRKWQFGLGALFALVHDVLFILGLFSLLNGVVPFSLDIDQAFIAAILTVVGYSINDTVVVFDRIREYLNLHHSKNADIEPIINDALNSTLSRTIITAVTTFFVLLVLFIFGGEVIRGFTFAMLVGVVVGTYSSIFIATPVVVDFMKKKKVK
ncbi:MAG: SecD/SecF fusion protein [Sphingobacteriales bacterium]|jgi:SecD/SecF fusion protein